MNITRNSYICGDGDYCITSFLFLDHRSKMLEALTRLHHRFPNNANWFVKMLSIDTNPKLIQTRVSAVPCVMLLLESLFQKESKIKQIFQYKIIMNVRGELL